jgi:hypothetical protein
MTPRHAAYIGWTCARLREYLFPRASVRVIYDEESGEMTDRIRVILSDDTIEVIVPEPHEAWHL